LAWLTLGVFVPVFGQNVLVSDYKGKLLPVVRASDLRPMVEVDGKLKLGDGRRFGLVKVPEYLPVFVSVRNLDVGSQYVDMNGSDINHDFRFRARLETPYRLEDVFVVLEMETDSAGKTIFLSEVGDLAPHRPKSIFLRIPMNSALGSGHYKLHLFSHGAEVFHSKLDPTYCDAVVDQMVHKRLAGVTNAAPTLFVGPGPEYPAALLKKNLVGHVVISLRIGANGRVYDPAVVSASDPAFGEAALTAVRLWRYLPRVEDGRPVETRASLPMDFPPPEEDAKKP